MWRIALLAIFIPLVLWGCMDKSIPVTETYTETEYKTEYRTETVMEIQPELIKSGEELLMAYSWYNTGSTSGAWGNVCITQPFWYFCYIFPAHSVSSVVITSTGQFSDITACDMVRIEEFGRNGAGDPYEEEIRYCDWLSEFNSKVAESRLIGKYSTGSDMQQLKIDTSGTKWLSIIVQGNSGGESSTFTNATLKWADIRDKEVQTQKTVEVKVPVTVEKQRTVNKTRSVPFWEALSGK